MQNCFAIKILYNIFCMLNRYILCSVFMSVFLMSVSAVGSNAASTNRTETAQKKGRLPKRQEVKTMALQIISSAFTNNGTIPSLYTCDGKDISPPLHWSNAPAGTKSFALINEDPDAPMGTWVHWLVWNIPATVSELKENVEKKGELADGTRQGMTDFGRVGYGGPCPPSGTHRYFFKLYALDTLLTLPVGAKKEELLKAMNGHILAEAQLVGTYQRIR